MTSRDKDRDDPASSSAGDGMSLLIGWRAGGEEAVTGEPMPDGNAEDPAETAVPVSGRPSAMAAPNDEPGTGAVPGPSETMADLAAGQQRILALLEDLASNRAAAASADDGTDLEEAAAAIQAATEWASDIRAAMDALLVTAGKSIRELNEAEQGLGAETVALKTRAEGIDGQIGALRSGVRAFGTRLQQLDEARQKLDVRSAELQAVKQEIAKYYGEWTAGALTYRQEMATLSKRLDEGENLVARVEQAIGPWTERVEKSLDENAKAQELATALLSGNVERLTKGGDAFLEKFGAAWNEALEGFRAEWRRTRRWAVPVLAAVLVLMVPTLPVMGALGQSEFGIFAPYDDTKGWKDVIWEGHGQEVLACVLKAMETNRRVDCIIDIAWPPPSAE